MNEKSRATAEDSSVHFPFSRVSLPVHSAQVFVTVVSHFEQPLSLFAPVMQSSSTQTLFSSTWWQSSHVSQVNGVSSTHLVHLATGAARAMQVSAAHASEATWNPTA